MSHLIEYDLVVVGSGAGGMVAARLWYLLRWLGHEHVALLDGGYGQWVKEGRPLDPVVPIVAPVDFVGAPRDGWTPIPTKCRAACDSAR